MFVVAHFAQICEDFGNYFETKQENLFDKNLCKFFIISDLDGQNFLIKMIENDKKDTKIENISFKMIELNKVEIKYSKCLVKFETNSEKNPKFKYFLFHGDRSKSKFYELNLMKKQCKWETKTLPQNLCDIRHAFTSRFVHVFQLVFCDVIFVDGISEKELSLKYVTVLSKNRISRFCCWN